MNAVISLRKHHIFSKNTNKTFVHELIADISDRTLVMTMVNMMAVMSMLPVMSMIMTHAMMIRSVVIMCMTPMGMVTVPVTGSVGFRHGNVCKGKKNDQKTGDQYFRFHTSRFL